MGRKVELLAPAGSFECLQAAINAGADAVYFGVEQLNMRAKSVRSFVLADLEQISFLCKTHGLKCYITLNTVMYNHDIKLLQLILQAVKKHEIDAVIASDFAVINQCKLLNIPLHISTQANVSNIEAAAFFADSADLIVLARELTLSQVSDICKEIGRRQLKGLSGKPLKIEIFVHGALCMAVSGKCYLSLHAQNASANRGACTQECRHPYKVTDLETGRELVVDNEYIMSPKDLCTINILDQLVNSGASVFKIEGRSKGPDYVYAVTKCYREALDAVEAGTYSLEKVEQWMTELSAVYNRGFWEGYYLGNQLGAWTSKPGSVATEKKVYLGRGTKYYPKINVAEFLIETGSLKANDTLMITGAEIGAVKELVKTLTVNGVLAEKATKGDKITFKFPYKVSGKDRLYKLVANDG
ncbi:peptidase U32 family protein [Pelobium manganitolerans]|nr:peptidase U32 family protein [Pelobium manganitolerans]